jgi:hypothetical protein
MSEFINQRIDEIERNLAAFPKSFNADAERERLAILEALKQAEEALKTCEARKNKMGYTFWVDIVKVENALFGIAALEKDSSG